MDYGTGNSYGVKEKGRVLFTGNGEQIIDDMIMHLPEGYQTEKCPAVADRLIGTLNRFQPQAIIVCMRDESREALAVYDLLKDTPRYQHMPVLAIGREEECKRFRMRVMVRTMDTLVKPVAQDRILEKLDRMIADTRAFEQKQAQEAPPAEKAVKEQKVNSSDEKLIRKIERETRIEGRKSILVVDDDVRMLNVIKMFLQDLYDITVVPSGKLALKFLSKKSADMVLLDYLMPEMDGPEVLRQIRQTMPNPEIPVVFLTGVADKDLVVKCLEFRPRGYLLKPVTQEALLEKVTEVLLGL